MQFNSSVPTTIYMAFIFILLPFSCVYADTAANRHNKMKCTTCHADGLTFADSGKELEFKKKDITSICLRCHSEIMNAHHPQRVQVTTSTPEYLPLGEGNSITCVTCHDIHMENSSSHLLRENSIGDYSSHLDICYECHLYDFRKISPHKNDKDGMSCLICHRDTPTIKDTQKTVTLVSKNIEKMCNFCHVIDTDNHPVNVDTTVRISMLLPRSRKNKVICTTCHDPHGSINTINFLREKYVSDLQVDKHENPHTTKVYFKCLKCHLAVPRKDKNTDCKYEDDYILLCYNCHGNDGEKCHPINIPLLEGMVLPEGFILSYEDLITCVTCHNPDCSEGTGIRYVNIDYLREDRCQDCHQFTQFTDLNPHRGRERESSSICFVCHRRNRMIEDLGLNQKFVCLKCHTYEMHPSDVNHIVKPTASMFLLPQVRLDNAGKIECSTCHDPHIKGNETDKLRKFEGIAFCEACHQL